MGLEQYHQKRSFQVTPEPQGKVTKKGPGKGHKYVVQKHDASHLHYDFRLEWAGVLLSWAIPKGPSLDPSVKRLAMQTEDHPIEYASFEGTIPEGQYGAGTVELWDRGTWEPEVPDVDAALRKGDLKFTLHGNRLKGSWVLVRTRGLGGNQNRSAWLLIKHRDEYASTKDVTTDPRSVSSARTLAGISKIAKAKRSQGERAGAAKKTVRAKRAQPAARAKVRGRSIS